VPRQRHARLATFQPKINSLTTLYIMVQIFPNAISTFCKMLDVYSTNLYGRFWMTIATCRELKDEPQ